MECSFEIEVKEPDTIVMPFPPSVKFRIKQLNMTPSCMSEEDIDFQISALIDNVEKLRKKVKKKLKDAKAKNR